MEARGAPQPARQVQARVRGRNRLGRPRVRLHQQDPAGERLPHQGTALIGVLQSILGSDGSSSRVCVHRKPPDLGPSWRNHGLRGAQKSRRVEKRSRYRPSCGPLTRGRRGAKETKPWGMQKLCCLPGGWFRPAFVRRRSPPPRTVPEWAGGQRAQSPLRSPRAEESPGSGAPVWPGPSDQGLQRVPRNLVLFPTVMWMQG